MTFKQIVDSFNSATVDLSILFKQFYYGTHLEYSRTPDLVYPNIYFENTILVQYNQNFKTYNCALVISDRSTESLSTRIDIESRLLDAAEMFIQHYNTKYIDSNEMIDCSFFLSEEQGADRTYNVRLEFKLIVQTTPICIDLSTLILSC